MIFRTFHTSVLCALLAVLLCACVSTGNGGNPWNRPGAVQKAENAPSSLDPEKMKQGAVPPDAYGASFPPARPEDPMTPMPAPAVEQQALGGVPNVPPLEAAPVVPSMPRVKVALLVPLSGRQAALGKSMLNAAQLALFDIGYDNFELMPRDTGGTPEGARKALESVAQGGAQLVLGPVFAPEVRAVKTAAKDHGLNIIAFSTDWTLADESTFVMGFLPFVQVERIVGYARAHGMGRIGVVAPDTDYGNAVVSIMRQSAPQIGVSIENVVKFPGNGDPDQAVQTLARGSYDAVMMPAGGEQARHIASLLDQNNLGPGRAALLGTGLLDDPSLAADPSMAGALFAAPAPRQRQNFESRYRDAYGLPPQRLATLAYDATALAAVLARNGYSQSGRPAFDRASLTNPNGFAGIDGIFRFRPDNLVERGLAVLQYKGGQIVEVERPPTTFQTGTGQGYGGL